MATPAKKTAQPIPINAAKGDPRVAPATASAPSKKRNRGKLLRIAVALAIATGVGVGGWFYLNPKAEDPNATAATEPKKQPTFLPIDQFTVNLPGAGGDHFLQIAFTLELADAKTIEDIKQLMPVIRGRLLLLLASKTVEDLSSTAGKQKLVVDILAESRAPLANGSSPSKGIENVHFSAFVIQ